MNKCPITKLRICPSQQGLKGVKRKNLHWHFMYNLVIGNGPLNHFLNEPSKTIQNVKEYLQQIS